MKILVTGATGRVGRFLVEQLLNAGYEVRALTRNPQKANLPAGVQVIAGDLTKPETLAVALEGISGLYMINFGGDDYAPLQTGAEIVAMAKSAGVRRITVLRGGQKGSVEAAVESSGLAWTFLEPVEFMTGALDWTESIRTNGEVRQPFGDRKTAIVHEADIAAVAARALVEDGHAGKTYSITGGEVLTPRAMVGIIGSIIGRDIPFIELTEAQAREEWTAAGLPQQVIEFFVWVYGNTPPAGYTVVPTVERVTGCPPRSFAQWVTEHIDEFRS
jgi:uncharacterized protein YbjT (DUF2867 family)